MSLTPDGRVTIPVDLAECKVELLGGRHSVQLEAWVLAMCEEIEILRGHLIYGFYEEAHPIYTQGPPTCELQDLVTATEVNSIVKRATQEAAWRYAAEEHIRELERKQFVGPT